MIKIMNENRKKSYFIGSFSSIRSGFTLIELMLVIAILGVLTALALGSYVGSQQRGRDARRKGDLHSIGQSLETYFNDYGRYPSSNAAGAIVGCDTATPPTPCTWGGQWRDSKGTIYMVILPGDPQPGKTYIYRSSGASYQLYASLENTQDGEYHSGGYSPSTLNCATSGTGLCTYGISSADTTP